MCDCIFCKIVSNEIPSMKVYEDERTVAFMDNAKDVDGHILVIPRKHCRSILDCDSETLTAVMQTVKTVAMLLTTKCGYEGVNLLNASEECAGQSVPHFHIHIIPRKNNDHIDAWPHFEGSKREVQSVYDTLKTMKESGFQKFGTDLELYE